MKYFFLIGFLTILACNSKQRSDKVPENKAQDSGLFVYPQEVKNAHVEGTYDSAKWYLYTWSCDKLYKPKNDTFISKPFGELELRFDNLFFKHDTLIIGFNFMDRDEPILPSMMRDYIQIVEGVGFDTTTKKKIFMASAQVTFVHSGNPNDRYANPLQPEVITFIKKDKDKLYPWFREEAKRRKIID